MIKRGISLVLCLFMALTLFSGPIEALADWGDGNWGSSWDVPVQQESSNSSQDSGWGQPSYNRFEGSFAWDEPPQITQQQAQPQAQDGQQSAASGQGSAYVQQGEQPYSQQQMEAEYDLLTALPDDIADEMEFDYVYMPGESKLNADSGLSYTYSGSTYTLSTGSNGGTSGTSRWIMDAEGNFEITLEKAPLFSGQSSTDTFKFTRSSASVDAAISITVVGGGGGGGAGGDCGSNGQHIKNGYGGNGGSVVTGSGNVSNYLTNTAAHIGSGGAGAANFGYTFCETQVGRCSCTRSGDGYGNTWGDPNKSCSCRHDSRDAARNGSNGGQSKFGNLTAAGGSGGKGGSNGRESNVNGSNGAGATTMTVMGSSVYLGYGGGGGYITHPANQSGYSWTSWPWDGGTFDPNRFHSAVHTGQTGTTYNGYGNGGAGRGTSQDYDSCTWSSGSGVTYEYSSGGVAGKQGIIIIKGKWPLTGKVEVTKTVTPSTESPEGFVFTVYRGDTAVGTGTTNASGVATIENIPQGDYVVKETPAAGWTTAADQNVTVTAGGTSYLTFSNTRLGKIAVTKNVVPATESKAGFIFDIYNSSNTVVGTMTTNASGTAESDWLAAGTYTVKERQSAGWTTDADQTATVSYGQTTSLTFTNTRFGRIMVLKTTDDVPASVDLSGFEFEILNSSDVVVETITTDVNGTAQSGYLPIATYSVREKANAKSARYNPNTMVLTATTTPGGNVQVQMTNTSKRLNASIRKVDTNLGTNAQGMGSLAGATYELFYYEGGSRHVASTGTTDANGNLVFPVAVSNTRDYYIVETAPSPGYLLDETTYSVTPVYNAASDSYTFTAQLPEQISTAPITVYKVDPVTGATAQGDGVLSGAIFDIYYDNSNTNNSIYFNGTTYNKGDLVQSITTNASGRAETGNLPYGKYRIVERKAPDGYQINPNAVVVSNANGAVAVAQNVNVADEIKTTTLQIKKGDALGNPTHQWNTLAGAIFSVKNASSHPIAIPISGRQTTRTDWTTPSSTTSTHYIYNSGAEICRQTTDASGECTLLTLPYGKYTVTEEQAPSGYYLDSSPQTITNYSGTEISAGDVAQFLNTPIVTLDGVIRVEKNILQATSVSENQVFYFTLNTNSDNGPLTGEYPFFIDGVETGTVNVAGQIPIKGGQTVEIKGLPVGMNLSYNIQEVTPSAGWTFISAQSSDLSGNVTKEAQATTAVLTNRYDATGTAVLNAQKEFIGGSIGANQFKFELAVKDGAPIESVYAAQGSGAVVFSALNYNQADAGKTFHYTIREVEKNDTTIVYSDRVCDVDVTVTDNGNGTLSTSIKYDGETAVPTFTNIWLVDIQISKELTGNFRNLNDMFTFTITLTNADNSPYDMDPADYWMNGNVHNWTNLGNGVFTFQLGHNEQISFPLRHGTKYTLSEDAQDYLCKIDGMPASSVSGTVDASAGDFGYAFTNTKNGVVPTAVDNDPMVGIGIALLAGAALAGAACVVALRKRGKHRA